MKSFLCVVGFLLVATETITGAHKPPQPGDWVKVDVKSKEAKDLGKEFASYLTDHVFGANAFNLTKAAKMSRQRVKCDCYKAEVVLVLNTNCPLRENLRNCQKKPKTTDLKSRYKVDINGVAGHHTFNYIQMH